MEWNEMKRINLEYSSIPLFGSFNGGNGKPIPFLFGSLSGRKWNWQKGTLISLYSLKTSNFHSPQNWEKWEGMKLDLMIFLLKLPKYPYIFNPYLNTSYNSIVNSIKLSLLLTFNISIMNSCLTSIAGHILQITRILYFTMKERVV